MERYPIPTTVDKFIVWLDEYGGWKQPGRYTIKSGIWNNEITHDVLAPDRKSYGALPLLIERDASTMERFWVTVCAYGDEVVMSPYLVEYRDSLIDAIRKEWQPSTLSEARPDLEPVPRPGTLERVREFHIQRKQGKSITEASRISHCDSRTYYDWCEHATSEEPIIG